MISLTERETLQHRPAGTILIYEGDQPRVLWKLHFPASVGMPVIADIDGDGTSDILVTTGDGYLNLLTAR